MAAENPWPYSSQGSGCVQGVSGCNPTRQQEPGPEQLPGPQLCTHKLVPFFMERTAWPEGTSHVHRLSSRLLPDRLLQQGRG